jgi:hypothetical protein
MSEFDDSQLLITFDSDATVTRFFGELYEDTQYLKLSTFHDSYHTGKCDTERCKGLSGVD